MPQISTGKCRSGQYSRGIIGQLKPITADIVPYEKFALAFLLIIDYQQSKFEAPSGISF